ncbi:hypothetical protein [Plantactinospora alkalitolerans]|nr:hypothetical protein [Plantactinospora alkalitolerans]
MRLRSIITSVAALVVAAGVAVVLALGQAQSVSDVAGYTWSN